MLSFIGGDSELNSERLNSRFSTQFNYENHFPALKISDCVCIENIQIFVANIHPNVNGRTASVRGIIFRHS